VPIGETLAQDRQAAGLTLAQVSRQTRIRESIIRKIEAGDFSECGGDFYARGHIRAIAKAVGTDPAPLIEEYDAHHRAAGALATVSLDELLAATTAPQRRVPDLPSAWARVTAAGVPVARKARPPAARGRAGPRYPPPRRTMRWALFVGLALVVVVLGFVALRVLAGAPPKAPPSAAGKHAPARHGTGRGRPGPAARSSHRAAGSPAPKASHKAPSPASAPQAGPLTPVRATAFGPNGGDNPGLAHLALAGPHSAGWHTDWYSSARFGGLYPGTGLLLNMGRTVTITGARIDLGTGTGATLQLRVGSTPTMAGLPPVARTTGAGGTVRLSLTSPARGRYVLLWFTRLPTDSAGTFQASVYHVSLQGRA
jgi:transcriptional regulator with XRE-family HTH domain